MAWLVKLVDKGKRKTEKQKEKKEMHHQIQRKKLLENVDGIAVNLIKVKVGVREEEEVREEGIMGSRREGGTAGESLVVEVRRGDRIITMVGSQVLREGSPTGMQVTL